ncbi:hypothetical protein [[Mycoplasma] testudinis]|uniref:hypothetical protein n=1 Tax=[Mycoplasma] testudinis TaxID=33924 RepID=UPI000481EEB8|nr:hypothetical protein [[Mycoplasma] testudinis]
MNNLNKNSPWSNFGNAVKKPWPKKKDIVFHDSDNYHYKTFYRMKLSKWIYIPIFGVLLFWWLWKNCCECNLIDRTRSYWIRVKFGISIFWPPLFLALCLIYIFMGLFLSDWAQLNGTGIAIAIGLTPLYALLLFQPISTWATKKYLLYKLFQLKNNPTNTDVKVYYNSKITDQNKYFQDLSKKCNKPIQENFYSDDMESVNYPEFTTNYVGTRIQQMKEYGKTQAAQVRNYGWFIPFFWPLVFGQYFDYVFFGVLLSQKAKLDKKLKLSKKINLALVFSWLLSLIIWAGFVIFAVSILTSFSYIPSFEEFVKQNSAIIDFRIVDAYKNLVGLHYLWSFIYLFVFALISLGRAQMIKKVIVKWCQKDYCNNY